MHAQYRQTVQDFNEGLARHRAGNRDRGSHLHLSMDLKSFSGVDVPIKMLEDLIIGKVGSEGRLLALVGVLGKSILGLNDCIARRERLISKFESGSIPENMQAYYYLGTTSPNGKRNEEYPDLVSGIEDYAQDITFFSSLLCDDLMEHGKRLREGYVKQFGGPAPNMHSVNFDVPKQAGMIRSAEHYDKWLRGFVVNPTATPDGRMKLLLKRFRRSVD
ncbi:MAG: hypothetical protein KIT63_13375 [Rhodoferax sp.]|nr:hypothetical protein [Rhodoferax sp.]